VFGYNIGGMVVLLLKGKTYELDFKDAFIYWKGK
jgi:hypothetical protein